LKIGRTRVLEHGLLVFGDLLVDCGSTGCVLFSLLRGRIRRSSKALSPCAVKAHAPTNHTDRRIRTTGSGESIPEVWRLSDPAATLTDRTVASSTRR